MTISMFRRRLCNLAHEFVSQAGETGTYGVAPSELERETHDNLLDCYLRPKMSVMSTPEEKQALIVLPFPWPSTLAFLSSSKPPLVPFLCLQRWT
jgi:hypothetical protein